MKAQDLAKGATSAQFDFEKAVVAADLTGVWTVNGVEYSFTELELVADIITEASAGTVNEVALLNLLNEAGIKNVDDAYLADYAVEIVAEAPVWFADVQKNIDDVNKDKAEDADEAVVVKAVADATTQVQLLTALQANFERVNPEWIVGYAQEDITAVTGTNMLDLDQDNYFGTVGTGITAADIQLAIDTENAAQIATANGALPAGADTAAEQAKVTALIQTWVEADDPATPLVTPKADAIEASKIKEAAFKVAEATTENSLYNALVAYADVAADSQLKVSELNANLKATYLAELNTATNRADLVTAIIGGTDNIKTSIVTAADATALEDVLVDLGAAATTLAGTDNATNREAFKAELQKLASYTSHQTATNAKFLLSTIDETILVDYATQMDADGVGTGDSVATVQGSVTTVNDNKDLLVAVDVIADSASTVTQVRDALVDLALSDSNTTTDAFVEASSQVKLEIAQFVVDNRSSLEDPLTAGTVTADGFAAYNTNVIGKAAADHAAKVAQFNAIGDLSTPATVTGTKTALDTYAYAPYVALTNAQKLAVAEEINSLTKPVGSPAVDTPLDFSGADAVTTLAQANAYIDAAITAAAN